MTNDPPEGAQRWMAKKGGGSSGRPVSPRNPLAGRSLAMNIGRDASTYCYGCLGLRHTRTKPRLPG